MKKEEVPQEKSALESANMTDLYYVTDEDGNYTTARSTGWEAKAAVANGTASPILYFMELNKMDFSILSSYVGIWTFFVKQHTKPGKFRKLSDKTLHKYADAFGISVEEIKNFDGK